MAPLLLAPTLAGITALLPLARAAASPFAAQQYLTTSAPYSLSLTDFDRLTSTPAVNASTPIPGYDLLSASTTTTTNKTSALALPGWALAVRVAPSIPLPNDEKSFTAAVLSLSPPAGLSGLSVIPATWSLCAAVWTLGLSEAALAGASTGSTGGAGGGEEGGCGGLLSAACVAEMEAGFASAGGNCQNQTMPRSCAGLFAAGPDGGAGGNLPQTMGELGEDGAFFAAVTGPLDKGDQTQVGAVAGWVFPVVLSWTHGGRDGSDPGETRAHVACVRAAAAGSLGAGAGNNGPGGIGFLDNGTSGSSMLRSGVGWWGQWVVLGVVVAWGLV